MPARADRVVRRYGSVESACTGLPRRFAPRNDKRGGSTYTGGQGRPPLRVLLGAARAAAAEFYRKISESAKKEIGGLTLGQPTVVLFHYKNLISLQ